MAVERSQPYPAQNFLVDLGDGVTDPPDGTFSEVTGLETWVDVIEYRTGGDKSANVHKITGLNKNSDVTLKRGVIGSMRLYKWFNQVRNGDVGAARTVTITLLAEDHTPVMVWKLMHAWPVKYTGPSLNGEGNDVAMESITLSYERLEME